MVSQETMLSDFNERFNERKLLILLINYYLILCKIVSPENQYIQQFENLVRFKLFVCNIWITKPSSNDVDAEATLPGI